MMPSTVFFLCVIFLGHLCVINCSPFMTLFARHWLYGLSTSLHSISLYERSLRNSKATFSMPHNAFFLVTCIALAFLLYFAICTSYNIVIQSWQLLVKSCPLAAYLLCLPCQHAKMLLVCPWWQYTCFPLDLCSWYHHCLEWHGWQAYIFFSPVLSLWSSISTYSCLPIAIQFLFDEREMV